MARTRFQNPKLHWDASQKRWEVRYREDVLDSSTQVVSRIRKKAFFTKAKYPTESLAKKALKTLLEPINSVTYQPRKLTLFRNFAEQWLTTVLPLHKPSSQSSTRGVINNYLVPQWGETDLKDIRTQVLQAWVMELAQAGEIGAKTISNIFAVLRMMWQSKEGGNAMNWELVTHNPLPGVRLPYVGKPETYAYTQAETEAILDALDGQDQLMIWVMAEAGMRPGEIPALTVSSIDFVEGKVKIEKAVSRGRIQTTKGKNKGTADGKKRSAALSANLLVALGDFIANRGGRELLFTEKNGRLVDMTGFRARFNEVLVKLGIRAKVDNLGIDRLGFYPLRHFSATKAAEEKLPMKTAMERLGHSKPDTHMIYNHVIDAAERTFADNLGAELDPRSRQ